MLFADDTFLFTSASDPNQTTNILNQDLQKITTWAKTWKVSFNPGKTKDVIFSTKVLFNSPPILFNDTMVDRVQHHKHLGVWLSNNLDFNKQIQEVCKKANSKFAVLRSVKCLNRSTLDTLYKLTVRSVIDYGLVVYFHSLKQTDIARLTQLQYRAAKLVTGAFHLTSTAKLNDELGWETIPQRAEFLGLSLFRKIHFYETRPLIRKCMPKIQQKENNTRSNKFYKEFPHCGKQFSDSYFPHFTKSWNNLENSLKTEIDLELFKEKLKIKLKPKKFKHFARGTKVGNKFQTQLRVGRSDLNLHKFTIGLSETSACLCDRVESVEHFLISCFLYTEERSSLFSSVQQLVPTFNKQSKTKKLDILLNGINLNSKEPDSRNTRIMLLVQNFILKTKRFSNNL